MVLKEQKSVWSKLKSTKDPIIMYGTGNGADKVLDILEERGIKIHGVTASSTFVRNRTFRGFQVMPISYFEEKFEKCTFIITFGSSIPDVMKNIFELSKKHTVLVPCVPVTGTEICDEKFLNNNKEQLEKAYSLLADDFSRGIFCGYIDFIFGGSLENLRKITTEEDEAFTNILKLSESETYVDIGAYRGDTVDTFLSYTNGKYENIICAEPDAKTYKKLIEHCESLDNFYAQNVAVTDIDGKIGFSDAHGRQSAVGGEKTINSVTVNTLCEGYSPSYIKIDSEGCENEILSAGKDILNKFSPKLNIAAYHKFSDIYTLPILINAINPRYKIHLRHHPYIPAWDTLFYCTL
ncbi:MAG: FkbM family methyltransferase [Clostridia bacterium]|nr:FkbM family methyltransferase [Clostridia bacterium]